MSTSDPVPNYEAADISSDLNAFILFIFLMGMYTVVYFGTIYVYFIKNPSKYHPVPAAMTMLYLSSIVGTAFEWYGTKWQFIANGSTRQSVFLTLLAMPPWLLIASVLSQCFVFVIADGLLIWRCFYVWNCSMRIISLPLLLIMAEFVLFLVEASLQARFNHPNITTAEAVSQNRVLAAALFMSSFTTLVTTILIAYRIYYFTKHEGASTRRFKHIIDIVVQSGAVYALAQLAASIANVVPGSDTVNPSNVAFEEYAQLINVPIAGISTTVMVARVALLAADTTHPSTSVHLSGLQFHARSTHTTVDMEAMDTTHSVDSGRISASEGQTFAEKIE